MYGPSDVLFVLLRESALRRVSEGGQGGSYLDGDSSNGMIFEFSGNGPVNMVSGYTVTINPRNPVYLVEITEDDIYWLLSLHIKWEE
jgi:hypothetical protein